MVEIIAARIEQHALRESRCLRPGALTFREAVPRVCATGLMPPDDLDRPVRLDRSGEGVLVPGSSMT